MHDELVRDEFRAHRNELDGNDSLRNDMSAAGVGAARNGGVRLGAAEVVAVGYDIHYEQT